MAIGRALLSGIPIWFALIAGAHLTYAQRAAISCAPASTTSDRTSGWCLMQEHRMPEAAAALARHLAAIPGDAEVSYWTGQIAYRQYEKEADLTARKHYLQVALFHLVRASIYDGPGALTPEQKTRLDTFVRAVYTQLSGSKDMVAPLEEVRELARTRALPPANFPASPRRN
jgi:hypothetical protein